MHIHLWPYKAITSESVLTIMFMHIMLSKFALV
jgi:hypothetical protein